MDTNNKQINTNENEKVFNELLEKWSENITFNLHNNFAQNVFNLKKGMKEKITLKPLDMLEYKKTIIRELQNEYTSEFKNITLAFSDSELLNNRIEFGKNKNQKITKLLSNILKSEYEYRTDQRLDYFHKLKSENNEYYIDNDPIKLLESYTKIETCVSPNGSNQGNIFMFLLSPYTYIAYDKKLNVRQLLYINFEKKKVFLHNVYGNYDNMFSMVIVKYFVDNDFFFVKDIDNFFIDKGIIYRDSSYCEYLHLVEIFNGKILNEKRKNKTHLFEKPNWYKVNGDYLVNSVELENDNLTTTYEPTFNDIYDDSEK
jgi:hypothetical protein